MQLANKDLAATFWKLTGLIDESQISLGVGEKRKEKRCVHV